MKQYDLETVIRRVGIGSGKWDEIQKILGYTPEDVIPFSVADMEFVLAPEISEGLLELLKELCTRLRPAYRGIQGSGKRLAVTPPRLEHRNRLDP